MPNEKPAKYEIQQLTESLVLVLGRYRPAAALLGISSRVDEISLVRLRRGHTRAQRHVAGLKVYPPYPNFNVTQATSAHILACIGCHKSQLPSSPTSVIYCLKTYRFMDLLFLSIKWDKKQLI
ncbi:hypothetical protein TNCV_1677091 [Trichonephila clavipes]|nr:hypothetical protein TNCV_1677091 [Trichonephila clavipes]